MQSRRDAPQCPELSTSPNLEGEIRANPTHNFRRYRIPLLRLEPVTSAAPELKNASETASVAL